MRILLNISPYVLSDADRRQILDVCPDAQIDSAPTYGRNDPDGLDGAGVDVLVTEQVPRRLTAWARLCFVQLLSAGIDHLRGHPVWAAGIPVATASGIHSVPMAQFATGMLLMMVHRVPELLEFSRTRRWPDRTTMASFSLRGLTAGILGYGSIGRECGRQLHALGMRIVCLDRDTTDRRDSGFNFWPGTGDPDGIIPQNWFTPEELCEFLPLCDVLVVAAPRTDRTRGMIGPAELRRMKPSARIIVISRGGIVDEEALIQALREKRIAGAALDTFVREPLPPDSPLFEVPNLILTPHVSGVFDAYWPAALRLLCENLRRLRGGLPLLNLACGELGY